MSETSASKEAVKKLQEFLKENHLQLRISPIKFKMVDDGSAIIEAPIIFVTPVEASVETPVENSVETADLAEKVK